MTVRAIVKFPNDWLAQPSLPVTEFGPPLEQLVADMHDTMRSLYGVGIAAVQIGIHLRVFLIAPNAEQYGVFINPSFEPIGKPTGMPEGCLSYPGIYDRFDRYLEILAKWTDLSGEQHIGKMDGLFAHAFQHELNHIDGVSMIDNMLPAAQKKLRKRVTRGTYGEAT